MDITMRTGLMRVLIIMAVAVTGLFHVAGAGEFEVFARVESLRKPDTITLSFHAAPEAETYYILEDGKAIGEVDVITVVPQRTGEVRYRAVARYRFYTSASAGLLRAGTTVALAKSREPYKRDFARQYYEEQVNYRKEIVSEKDSCVMLLIEKGKFIMGSDCHEKDESPASSMYLGDFYIDKYEISNSRYLGYMKSAGVRPPLSWKDGRYPEEMAEMPVLVTYYEAEAYAKWAGKRLPTEEEWEKAARGASDVGAKPEEARVYPWGNTFSPKMANCRAFWEESGIREDLKSKTPEKAPALLPVNVLEKEGASPYGVVNMSGNAMEWTSSWYLPYKNNHYRNSRYGRQYRVVRGGAYYSDRDGLRVSKREIGGIPSLYRDNLAGFRCVKEPTPLDRIMK